MWQERTERERRTVGPDVERPPTPAPPSQELLLRLQRSAGNAAVQRLVRARMLQRDPVAPAPDPAPTAAPAAPQAEPGSFAALSEAVTAKIEALKAADAAVKAA